MTSDSYDNRQKIAEWLEEQTELSLYLIRRQIKNEQ